jgi:hypothetical protein
VGLFPAVCPQRAAFLLWPVCSPPLLIALASSVSGCPVPLLVCASPARPSLRYDDAQHPQKQTEPETKKRPRRLTVGRSVSASWPPRPAVLRRCAHDARRPCSPRRADMDALEDDAPPAADAHDSKRRISHDEKAGRLLPSSADLDALHRRGRPQAQARGRASLACHEPLRQPRRRESLRCEAKRALRRVPPEF